MKTTILIFASIALFCSCGNKNNTAQPQSKSIHLSFSFSNTQTWPQRYQIILGSFAGTSKTPLSYKALEKTSDGSIQKLQLDVSETAENVCLYLANTARQPICIFWQSNVSGASTQTEVIPIDILNYQRIQAQVFNTCLACHGGSSGLPAGGLNLLEAQSWNNLVNQPSAHSSKKRVVPFDAKQSFIIQVMEQDNINFSHSASNTIVTEDIELTKQWIEKGAVK